MITNNIVLEILKGVCLSVDQVPKLIQNFFSTMEQKLIQRCETEIVADACIASYQAMGSFKNTVQRQLTIFGVMIYSKF